MLPSRAPTDAFGEVPDMTSAPVYLDWNATAPLREQARRAMVDALDLVGNPSSIHRFGRAARLVVETARDSVASLVGAEATWVVFTSGGSEANALALRGTKRPVFSSVVEHVSVTAARTDGVALPVDGAGRIDLSALERALGSVGAPALVSVMLANNETGVVQPVAEAAAIAHAHGALLHCDAVQGAGRIVIDMADLGIDLLTLSAHKLGGPQGVGTLVCRSNVALTALQQGGGQERGLRAGTENVAGIAGFGAACLAARLDLAEAANLARLRERLECGVRRVAAATQIIASEVPRIPNTSCLVLPGVEASTLVMALDLAGIAVSAGSACSSGKVRPSHVLAAMGLASEFVKGGVRVSLGWSTKAADIDRCIDAWGEIATRLAARQSAAA